MMEEFMDEDHMEPYEKQHIMHFIKLINVMVEKNGNALLKEKDLTLWQGHILRMLKMSEEKKIPLKLIEQKLDVAQSTAAGMVARMEKKGFVETLSDPADKRIKIVALTQFGEECAAAAKQSISKVEKELFSPLTEEEKETLETLLKKVVDFHTGEKEPFRNASIGRKI